MLTSLEKWLITLNAQVVELVINLSLKPEIDWKG